MFVYFDIIHVIEAKLVITREWRILFHSLKAQSQERKKIELFFCLTLHRTFNSLMMNLSTSVQRQYVFKFFFYIYFYFFLFLLSFCVNLWHITSKIWGRTHRNDLNKNRILFLYWQYASDWLFSTCFSFFSNIFWNIFSTFLFVQFESGWMIIFYLFLCILSISNVILFLVCTFKSEWYLFCI